MDIPTKHDDDDPSGNNDNLDKNEGFHFHQKIMEEIHDDMDDGIAEDRDHGKNKARRVAWHDSAPTDQSGSNKNENDNGGNLDVERMDRTYWYIKIFFYTTRRLLPP